MSRSKLLRGIWGLVTIALLLLLVQGGLILSSSKNAQAASTQKKVVLTIEVSQELKNNNPHAFAQENIDAFQRKYPNITVKLILDPDAQTKTILQTKLAAGQPSDIICYNKVSAENELDVVKNFVDLSNEPWVAKLTNPDALKAPNGKIYGFSMKNMIGGMGIVYDKDVFKKLNISIPKTWDQFVAVCKTLKANGYIPIYAPFKDIWTFQMYTTTAWGYYAAKIEPGLWDKLNTRKIKWTDVPAFLDSLTKLYNLYKDGYMQRSLLSDDYIGAVNAFRTKKYAMMMGADVTATELMSKLPYRHFGMFPLPMFKGEYEYLTIAQLDGVFFIPKAAKHIAEAKLYLNFLAQPEQMNRAQKVRPFVPSVKGAKIPKFDPFLEEIYKKYNLPGKTVLEMNAYMKVDLTPLWRYYQEMFAGMKTPKQVLEAWDNTFVSLMKEKGYPGF